VLQLRDQSTPADAESFETIAVNETEREGAVVCTYSAVGITVTAIDAGGGGGGGVPVTVTVALTDFVVSVSEVAVIVTVFPAGTEEGAV